MAPSIAQPRSFKGEWAAQRHAFKHAPRHGCAVNMYVSKHYINPNKLDISCQMVSNAWWLPRLPLKWSHKFPVCIRFCTYQKTNTMLLNCHVFLGNYWSTGGGNDWTKQTEKKIATEATNRPTWLCTKPLRTKGDYSFNYSKDKSR